MPFFKLRKKRNVSELGLNRTRVGLLGRIAGIFSSGSLDDEFWDTLEESLISADVGVRTTSKLCDALRERIKKERLSEPEEVKRALKEEMVAILEKPLADVEFLSSVNERPAVVLVVGVNGAGKTTSIAKIAHAYIKEGETVVLAAGDTFRAAAIEQLKLWGEKVGAEVISHQQGSDPGAVAFDALNSAKGRRADLVMIDTAGRLHTKYNLMEELKKVNRVVKRIDSSAPHEILLVLDAVIGQNAIAQAKHFVEATGVTGVFLAKLDGSAKGGVVLNICDELGIPIRFIGTGEDLVGIAPFAPEEFVAAMFE